MNRRMIFRIIGYALLVEAGLMLVPALVGLLYKESPVPFLAAAAAAGLTGFICVKQKPDTEQIYARDGFVAVALVWIFMAAFGAVPFVISGDIPGFENAFFETMSGLTTTGASVVNDIESMTRGGLFWRCFTHWIGGMGVLVFMMAILPMSGEHSMHIMRAEVPGPVVGKLVPRASDTAKILYVIYAALTLLEAIFLLAGGMSPYESILHAFATAGTGGFSTRNDSIAAFNSPYIENVIAVFLVFFGVNFNLYYFAITGRIKEALKSEELHWYLLIILGAVLAVAAGIYEIYGSIEDTLRNAFFNVITIMSTAGFCTVDYTYWPQYTNVIIVVLMFIGGCAGSTGGGMKLSRIILLVKNSMAKVSRMFSPRRVKRVYMDGRCVSDDVIDIVSVFAFMYLAVLLICTFLISFDGVDFTTGFTAALSCISNVGPGLGKISPAYNFSYFSSFAKVIMSFTMLTGRLEIFPVMILFMPKSIRNR